MKRKNGPRFFRIRNWKQFQHYGKRNPPWIRLYFSILASRDWIALDDASRVLCISSMLIASRNNGFVPADPKYVRSVGSLNQEPDFGPLIECGFLARASKKKANASRLLAPRYQRASKTVKKRTAEEQKNRRTEEQKNRGRALSRSASSPQSADAPALKARAPRGKPEPRQERDREGPRPLRAILDRLQAEGGDGGKPDAGGEAKAQAAKSGAP